LPGSRRFQIYRSQETLTDAVGKAGFKRNLFPEAQFKQSAQPAGGETINEKKSARCTSSSAADRKFGQWWRLAMRITAKLATASALRTVDDSTHSLTLPFHQNFRAVLVSDVAVIAAKREIGQ